MSAVVIAHLSEPRFNTYRVACNGDDDEALRLYRANIAVSNAAHGAIHIFEIVLRNRLDASLRDWNRHQNGSALWSINPAPMLADVIGRDRLREARTAAEKAVGARRRFTHDDVVAQFTLGTWRWMLPSQSNVSKKLLWTRATSNAFPYLYDVRVETLIEWISIVYDFRNRVAHFEPVYGLDLRGKRQAIRNVLQTVSADVRKWFLQHDAFGAALWAFYDEWPQFDSIRKQRN